MNLTLKKYIRKGFETVQKQMLYLDKGFDDEMALCFLDFQPSPGDLAAIKEYPGDLLELDDASKFIYHFQHMPLFHPRCQFTIFAKDTPDKLW